MCVMRSAYAMHMDRQPYAMRMPAQLRSYLVWLSGLP